VDRVALMRVIENWAQSEDNQRTVIARTLALGCWLHVRAGRWAESRRKVRKSTMSFE
jgi:hypothetical protein